MEVIYSALKVQQNKLYLFIENYKSNKIKICMNEMRVNNSEMSMRRNNETWSIPEISDLR